MTSPSLLPPPHATRARDENGYAAQCANAPTTTTTTPANTPEERLVAEIDDLIETVQGHGGTCIHNPSDLREFAADVIALLARNVAA